MRRLALVIAVSAAACGGSSSGSTNPDVQRFNAVSQSVATAAASYGTRAASMTSVASCGAAESAYDGQARPMVDELQSMGTAMDADMGGAMHQGSDADMECAANAMMAELDRHRGAACLSTTDMAPNVAEAQQHVATMTQWADHEMARSAQMGGMMGMGGMGGAGTSTGHCVHDADGAYRMHP